MAEKRFVKISVETLEFLARGIELNVDVIKGSDDVQMAEFFGNLAVDNLTEIVAAIRKVAAK